MQRIGKIMNITDGFIAHPDEPDIAGDRHLALEIRLLMAKRRHSLKREALLRN